MQFKLLLRLNNVVLHDFYCCCRQANDNWNPPNYYKKIILTICLPVKVGDKKKKENICYIKVCEATRWIIRHGLMLLWLKDLMNVTVGLQSIDPMFRHISLVPSLRQVISKKIKGPLVAAIRSPLMKALDGSVETLGLWIVTSRLHS